MDIGNPKELRIVLALAQQLPVLLALPVVHEAAYHVLSIPMIDCIVFIGRGLIHVPRVVSSCPYASGRVLEL